MIVSSAMTEEDLRQCAAHAIGPDADYAVHAPGSITLRDDGRIIAVGGINWYWDGVGEAWVILHERSRNCRFATYRALKRMHDILLSKAKPFQRIQATVRTNWPEAIKMAEKLGYKREGRMKNYCPDGTDVYMYAVTP